MQLEVGTVLEGKVSGVMNFGAFIAFEDGQSGLVHISEISNEYVEDINQCLKVGQQVSAKVLSIDNRGKIALSIKQAQPGYVHSEKVSKPRPPRPPRQSAPRPAPVPFDPSNPPVEFTPVPGKKAIPDGSFEDKMLKFKQDSEDKMHSLKRESANRRGGGKRG